jgi:RNA polymerase sigma-70 factor (ECF subfamily)
MSAALALRAGMIAAAIRHMSLASVLSPIGERLDGEVTDTELVAQARRGNPRALQIIYQRYATTVYRRLTHLVGADPEREDLMQEAFADLFRQLDSFRGDALLRTYLFRIVANKAYDHLRRRQRRHRDEASPTATDDSEARGAEASVLAASPEDHVRARQELALVWRAIEELTPKKRIAYLLRVVEGLSLKEIAEQVGATVFTVAQRIRHADREIHHFIEQKS